MEIIATQKYVRMSPKKIRFVVRLVKNMLPAEALDLLPTVGKKAAEPLLKVIKTAIGNAKQRGLKEADLILKEIQIGEGPRLKRGRIGGRGRWKPIIKPMSHIRVVLSEKGKEDMVTQKEREKK